jgi:hypothetical protein
VPPISVHLSVHLFRRESMGLDGTSFNRFADFYPYYRGI